VAIKATLNVTFGSLMLSLTPKSLSVCEVRTDVASGELVAHRDRQLEKQIKAAGLALVRFAELLS
jgi:hypothetical protein